MSIELEPVISAWNEGQGVRFSEKEKSFRSVSPDSKGVATEGKKKIHENTAREFQKMGKKMIECGTELSTQAAEMPGSRWDNLLHAKEITQLQYKTAKGNYKDYFPLFQLVLKIGDFFLRLFHVKPEITKTYESVERVIDEAIATAFFGNVDISERRPDLLPNDRRYLTEELNSARQMKANLEKEMPRIRKEVETKRDEYTTAQNNNSQVDEKKEELDKAMKEEEDQKEKISQEEAKIRERSEKLFPKLKYMRIVPFTSQLDENLTQESLQNFSDAYKTTSSNFFKTDSSTRAKIDAILHPYIEKILAKAVEKGLDLSGVDTEFRVIGQGKTYLESLGENAQERYVYRRMQTSERLMKKNSAAA